MSTELSRVILTRLKESTKLNGGDGNLAAVCSNAPEGDHPDGGTYRDHCDRCLELASQDASQDATEACIAQVISGYLESQSDVASSSPDTIESTTPETNGAEAPVGLSSCPDPTDPACAF